MIPATDAGVSLTLRATELFIRHDIDVGAGDLEFDVTDIWVERIDSGVRILRGNNITLRGDVSVGVLSGPNFSLGGAVTIDAGGNLIMAGGIDAAGGGSVTLRAGGEISNGDTVRTIRGRIITLEQSGLFAATARFTFTGTGARELHLITTSTDEQPLHDWMVESGRSLSLTAAGDIQITTAAVDLGTGDLTLSAAAISAAAGLTVTAATFNLAANALIAAAADIDLSGVDILILQNSAGTLISAGGTLTLAEITRTQDADGNAFAAPLTLRAGTLVLNTSNSAINIGGSLLAITAGATPANLAARATFTAGRYGHLLPLR